MNISLHQTDDEFLAVACQAMDTPDGNAALDTLGWWDLLPHLDDPEARAAVFGVFRAQGRVLGASSALGGVMAQPFLEATGLEAGSVVAAAPRVATKGRTAWTLIGKPGDRHVLIPDPDAGLRIVSGGEAQLTAIEVPGQFEAFEVTLDGSASAQLVDATPEALERSAWLGRIAAAAEILGAAEGAVELSRQYACDREQFGQPIGKFQAVRHLLAWATTDCVAVDAVLAEAIAMIDNPVARFDQVTKAIAGRNGRRACERSLQVLGGIGFTAEHVHHHHHSRVLFLDALLGNSASLSRDLGAWLRSGSADPRFAEAVLLNNR
jgi:hypothetical protein